MKIDKYLQQSPLFALNAAYETVITSLNREMRQEGLNLLQGLVLTSLFFEGRTDVTPSSLADVFRTSRGNISHIISSLEEKGYVRRRLDVEDARRFHLELKPEGRRKALHLIRFYDRWQDFFEKEVGVGVCRETVGGLQRLTEAFKTKGRNRLRHE